MFSNFLVKRFVKDSENVSDIKVRGAYANLAGVVGIITNLILFIIKLSVGLLSNSVSILADAFNNLSDAASSIITIVGFKMANKPADAEHPFGHGRIEYITAMIVSFMVMLVGLQFVKTSFQKIINPTPVTFELLPFILLLVSIVFKFWLSKFNKSIGNKINSSTLKATATDAMGDVFTSTTVVISFFQFLYDNTDSFFRKEKQIHLKHMTFSHHSPNTPQHTNIYSVCNTILFMLD